MAAVILAIDVPEPWKDLLDSALRRSLEHTNESWSVEMREAADTREWMLAVHSSSGRFWSTSFGGFHERDPSYIEARVREWLVRGE
jgi:hypothetical protein